MAGVLDNIWAQFTSKGVLGRLLIINVAIFFLCVTVRIFMSFSGYKGVELDVMFADGFGKYIASTAAPGELIKRPWTVLTHMFAHFSISHILFNMIGLYFIGRMFVHYFGQRKLLSTYLLGGFAGFLAYFIAYNLIPDLDAESLILGASAAVYAIFIACAAYRPKERIMLFGVFPIQLQLIAAIFVVADYVRLASGDNTGGHLGHLGGALYGFVWGRAFLTRKDMSRGFDGFLDRFFSFFKWNRGMRVVKKPKTRAPKSDEAFNAEKKSRQRKLDAILDKISKGGWDSLNKEEKDFLSKYN